MEITQITSKLAEQKTEKEAQKIKIINALHSLGGYGNTEQIERAINEPTIDHVAISRRTREMIDEGRIALTPVALRNKGNNLCTVYRLPHITQITLQVA